MATLDYQDGRDHAREAKAAWHRRLGALLPSDVFRSFAEQIGAEFIAPMLPTSSGQVVSLIGPWRTVFGTNLRGELDGRLDVFASVRFVMRLPLHLRIRPVGVGDQLKELFCMGGLPTGDAVFDGNFVTRSSNRRLARDLLADSSVRTLYRNLLTATLSVQRLQRFSLSGSTSQQGMLKAVLNDCILEDRWLHRLNEMMVHGLRRLAELGIADQAAVEEHS